MKNDDLLVSILKDQVVPALGCTEPMAVAYAVAKGKEIIEEEVKEVNISVDKNIFKNGKEVGIPGTDKKGIIVAAALSIIVGNSEYKLQVLKDLTNDDIEKALKLLNKNIIKLYLKEKVNELYIEVIVKGQHNTSKVVIKNSHLNIVLLEKNGKCISEKPTGKISKLGLRDRIREFNIKDFKDFVDKAEYDKIKFINEGIVMNKKIAEDSLSNSLGMGLGNLLYKDKESIDQYAKAITSSACEARMSGHPLPVMSSAGSGNHGLVAILPVASIGERLNIDNDKIIRSVALSHLVTIYIKSYTGALSPVCGCGVAAGVGASAGITYLLGGDIQQIYGAIKNMIAGISGMICDGAKLGCAYKLCVSVSSAIDAAKMALDNIYVPSNDGILDNSAEKSIQNLGKVSTDGMSCTDEVILNVMIDRCS
ncbi:serine dehydratase subunit alpha family protein [Clostridium rectalis]|uniref:L-cysteine desulfidase family protein n=1 Tax=Clostridium rectalis TaxID=2040295 RepID=UPI000F63E4E3|nr:L-serine ammonia-lyase, iron-sulfur-dependent, subunit alpha [Clostridium rectalis]